MRRAWSKSYRTKGANARGRGKKPPVYDLQMHGNPSPPPDPILSHATMVKIITMRKVMAQSGIDISYREPPDVSHVVKDLIDLNCFVDRTWDQKERDGSVFFLLHSINEGKCFFLKVNFWMTKIDGRWHAPTIWRSVWYNSRKRADQEWRRDKILFIKRLVPR